WLPPNVRLVGARKAKPLVALTIALCLVSAFAATVLSIAFGGHLPALIQGRAFTAATTAVMLPLILLFDTVAVVVLNVGGRSRTTISLWLSIAIVASALDAFMGVSSSRYSYGWYVGKIFFVVSSGVMLVAFIAEMGRLQIRLGRAHDDLKRTRERERHLAQERFQHVTLYDELTGLSNRNHLEERLRALVSAPNSDKHFALLFFNIDNFKEVNDRFGHAAADRLLTEVAARLTAGVGPDDTVARFSGDEFVVVAPSLAAADDAGALAEALREALSAPFGLLEGSVRIAASVGIAMFPDDGASAEAVLDNADAAARQAKRTGGDRAHFYSRDFVEEARERRRLQEDLSLALLHDQFVLHYQPILDLRTGELEKVEALIRWVHPTRGIVSPDAFIPLAEQTGLMQIIGYWVMEEAVRQASAWEAAGTPTRIAVNVSARQLDDRAFLTHLTRTLGESQLPARLLELEITESAAMTDASLAQDVLEECRSLGLGVSLDDFGTYYSSLTYLKRLPIDTVKIDRTFIQGLPFVKSDAAIVSGILGLAKALERRVVAEGIETEPQHAWLTRAGCDLGQGYLFGRPMPAPALAIWRRSHHSLIAGGAGNGAARESAPGRT
ncbi:MAG: hypothetical protein JWO66_2730, partial [Candidatus Eremiobacteraeota bacterium]|nr:hypothetical protein [Candidatus Eremiobacteraeota bacterium]